MEDTEMLKTFVFLAAIFSGAAAWADLIYLSQSRTLTEIGTIAKAVPDVKTKTVSAPDFGPVDFGNVVGGNSVPIGQGDSAASLIGHLRSTLSANTLSGTGDVHAYAIGDSTNQYGVAEGSVRAVIQF